MIALKLQQLQYNVKENGRGACPMLFGPSDGSPPGGGGQGLQAWVNFKGGIRQCVWKPLKSDAYTEQCSEFEG